MIGIKSVEHGVAAIAHDILIGARAVGKVLGAVQKYAPLIEADTALIDPRAAQIERVGAALIGELQPQVDKATAIGNTLQAESASPALLLSPELIIELQTLYGSMKTEIAGVKATVAAGTKAAS